LKEKNLLREGERERERKARQSQEAVIPFFGPLASCKLFMAKNAEGAALDRIACSSWSVGSYGFHAIIALRKCRYCASK